MGEFTTLREEQDARIALLRYYSSERMAHGAYILTIALGFLGLIEAMPYLPDFDFYFYFPISIRNVIVSLGLGAFVTLGINTVGRTFFWGHLTSAVLRVKPLKEEEIELEEGITITLLDRLHRACSRYVEKKYKKSGWFSSTKEGHLLLIFVLLSIAFFISTHFFELLRFISLIF